jgi:NAD(P)-dependent dehydrogenase (short-subunit alcohol dehydrogenase family)
MNLNAPITDWNGKRVWLIGASSGIGEALAKAMLDAGASVVLSARREDQLRAVAADYPKAHVLAMDVTNEAVWPQALTDVTACLGGLDLVVFGAARYDPAHSWEIDPVLVEKSFELNVVCIYRGLSTLIPYFLKQGSGGIALIASISGYTGLPRTLIYGATKAALNHLAQTLYFELAPKGLSVYLINPGFVATPMTAVNEFSMPGLMTPAAAAVQILKGFKKGRFEICFPLAVARALRFIAWLPDCIRFKFLHKLTKM